VADFAATEAPVPVMMPQTIRRETVKQELSDAELNTYARQIVLSDIGYDGQLKLRNATACIVGLGGLGSLIAPTLVGMGIGQLRLVDRDIVSRSNLHRQHLYDVDAVGRPKVEVAYEKLSRLNPDVDVVAYPETLTAYNAIDIISGADVVIDGLDRPEPRYIINETCNDLKIPYIFGAAIEAFGNVTTILPDRSICLECFMPGLRESDLPKCGVVGVHPSILSMVTAVQVSEAVNVLTGREPKLADKLFYLDLREMTFETLSLTPEKDCSVCGTGSGSARGSVSERLIEETCARDGRRNIVVTPTARIELDLSLLGRALDRMGFSIKTSGSCGITFVSSHETTVCILKRGGMIAQTSPMMKAHSKKDILDIYRSVLVEGMGFPPDIVPDE
jgi:molybdopterin-synthase adenylyltransferase